MSFTIIIKIRCDWRRVRDDPFTQCNKVLTLTQPLNKAGLSATYAADLAERRGWWARGNGKGTSTPKLAHCPQHNPTTDKEASK